jgi:hypothetical protein
MKRIKPFLVLVLLVALVYLLWGVHYASYAPEVSDAYRWGAWHVHSTFSDGLLSLPEIAEEARKARVDFVLLTDHGRPNRQTSTLDETVGGVRFIGGSESGIPEGHINFFGAKEIPLFNLPPFPPDAFDDIREWGGFGVLTYPEDPRDPWRYWESDLNPDGIEIINITSYFRRASVWGMLGTAIFAPFSDYLFLKDITPPVIGLKRWDELRTPTGGFPSPRNRTGPYRFRRTKPLSRSWVWALTLRTTATWSKRFGRERSSPYCAARGSLRFSTSTPSSMDASFPPVVSSPAHRISFCKSRPSTSRPGWS